MAVETLKSSHWALVENPDAREPVPAYDTSVYPYPQAMWDEAYSHLQDNRGWMTVLLMCPPDFTAETATAVTEMENRGLSNPKVLIYFEDFSNCCCIRISRMRYIEPRWDDVESHLKNNKTVGFLAVRTDNVDTNALVEETRAAMLERGLNVSVGFAIDPISNEGLLRIERA